MYLEKFIIAIICNDKIISQTFVRKYIDILLPFMLKCDYRMICVKGADFMSEEQNLKSKIDEIYTILDELQFNQLEQFLSIQKNQSLIIKKIEKLQEYNEIDDMVNSLFDRRLSNIEQKM